MAYVATVNTLGGGQFTGTSLALNSGNYVLTGSLTVVSEGPHVDQYTKASATTANIPLYHVEKFTVA